MVEAEDQGAMCLGEAGHKLVKETQEQEYTFEESRQVVPPLELESELLVTRSSVFLRPFWKVPISLHLHE